MDIDRDGHRASKFSVCVNAAHAYGLSRAEASDIIERQVTTVRENWADVCDLARLTQVESSALFERQILRPLRLHHLKAPSARAISPGARPARAARAGGDSKYPPGGS